MRGDVIPVRITNRLTFNTTQDITSDPDEQSWASVERVRKKTKRFYIGGFGKRVRLDYLDYITRKSPKVTMIRVFPSRAFKDRVVLRENVEADENTDLLLQDGFLPERYTCRPWLSRSQLRKSSIPQTQNVNVARVSDKSSYINSTDCHNRYLSLASKIDLKKDNNCRI